MNLNILRTTQQQHQFLDVNENFSKPKPMCFKTENSFIHRKKEVMAIRSKYPTKIPLVLEKYHRDSTLPTLAKNKFLVPEDISMSQFLVILRNRIKIAPTQVVYLLINNRTMLSMSLTMAQAYREYADEDGFLYVTYASENFLGHKDADEMNEQQVRAMRHRFPNKIPLHVERHSKDNVTPALDKKKFLMPQELTMGQFLFFIRGQIKIKETQALILLIDSTVIPSNGMTLAQIYELFRAPDGLLHVVYTTQPVFG